MARKTEITRELLMGLKMTKVFPDSERPVSSLSFDDTGEFCVTAGEDDSLNVYNCREGKLRSTLYSKKYGVTLARFTHHKNNVIYASTKEDDTLRYLSVYDNKYIRYFRGHKKRVINLEMSPADDTVITSSLDETVRLWDLRSSTCQGMVVSEGKPLASFDPQGLVFATAASKNIIRIYDSRHYEKGPFSTWQIEDPDFGPAGFPEWTSMKFTADGKHIVISTVSDRIYVLDAFDGALKYKLVGSAGMGQGSCGEEVSLSPDARYVVAGGRDSNLRVWDLQSQMEGAIINPFVTLPTTHKNGIKVTGFNPSHFVLATGNESVAFWQPPP
ncbi:WD40 repeat-like protein [Backusella circina FSU 941]|nr:WD40 repeat-like protein [Backusella circina FSU 941]